MDMNLSILQEVMEPGVHGVNKIRTHLSDWTTKTTIKSANTYFVPGPAVEAENRTMTKAGKDPLSRAGISMEQADETHINI